MSKIIKFLNRHSFFMGIYTAVLCFSVGFILGKAF